MKIVAFSKNGKMAKMSDDTGEEKWYFFTEKVEQFIKKFSVGDTVEATVAEKEGKQILTFIKGNGTGGFSPKTSTASFDDPSETDEAPKTTFKSTFTPAKTWGKSPEEQNTIKRQAIGHMVSRTLISMQGLVSVDNVEGIIDRLYAKYQEVVG